MPQRRPSRRQPTDDSTDDIDFLTDAQAERIGLRRREQPFVILPAQPQVPPLALPEAEPQGLLHDGPGLPLGSPLSDRRPGSIDLVRTPSPPAPAAPPVDVQELAPRPQRRMGDAKGDVPDFTGEVGGIGVTDWLRKFDRYIMVNDFDDMMRLRLFGTYMTETAETWYEGLTEEVKDSWVRLEATMKAYFAHVQPIKKTGVNLYSAFLELVQKRQDLAMLQDRDKWHEHLDKILSAAVKVGSRVPQDILANQIWASLPSCVQALVPSTGTATSVIHAAKTLQPYQHEQIVQEMHNLEDTAEFCKVFKDYLQGNAPRPGDQSHSVQIGVPPAQFSEALRRQQFGAQLPPPPVPVYQAAVATQPAGLQGAGVPAAGGYQGANGYQAAGGFQGRAPFAGRGFGGRWSQPVESNQSLTFPDTPEGQQQYEEAMRGYHQQHPMVRTEPPVSIPYPLTPGTLPVGISNDSARAEAWGGACTQTGEQTN